MSELSDQLRELADWRSTRPLHVPKEQRSEWLAADALDAKDEEIVRLREALEKIARHDTFYLDRANVNICVHHKSNDAACADCHAMEARDALSGKGEG